MARSKTQPSLNQRVKWLEERMKRAIDWGGDVEDRLARLEDRLSPPNTSGVITPEEATAVMAEQYKVRIEQALERLGTPLPGVFNTLVEVPEQWLHDLGISAQRGALFTKVGWVRVVASPALSSKVRVYHRVEEDMR